MVVSTLLYRAETVVSEPKDVEEEVKHVKKVLIVYGYKKWSFQIPKKKVGEEDKKQRVLLPTTPGVHPLHLGAVRTTTEGI